MKNKKLVKTLISKNLKICAAESCTGGLFMASLIDVPGSSAVIDTGFITYANSAKTELLGVDPLLIEKNGVVSECVAASMAQGAAEKSGADIGVGISGIAGPGGATKTKPVGTVCFGFYINGKTVTKTLVFENKTRLQVRKAATETAIDTLLDLI